MALESLPPTASEGDAETLVTIPLLTRGDLLGINQEYIKSKEYLPKYAIGKGSHRQQNFVPDYIVYLEALPVMVVEVKAPSVDVDKGYVEASMYAHVINSKFSHKLNPCQFILATNGQRILAGHWDGQPIIKIDIDTFKVGDVEHQNLLDLLSLNVLRIRAKEFSAQLKSNKYSAPYLQGNGSALINSRIESNSFAAELSPILRRYFSSRDQNSDAVIYNYAYVSSNEVTTYDRALEHFLKDRLARSRNRVAVSTTKKRSDEMSSRIQQFRNVRLPSGDLQIITGGVGAGKSLFARRYKEKLQSPDISSSTYWSFLDFNNAPEDLTNSEDWILDSFIESIIEEGAPFNINDPEDQERLFATEIEKRNAYYHRMESIEKNRGLLEKARDIETWRVDPRKLVPCVARYIQGDRGECLVTVFDNVDRRNSENQLAAFQLALWFMAQTRCLLVLQMRDVTFELHKDEPPLDTYKTGQIFHISPPRFIDVVSKRLELSLAELTRESPAEIMLTTSSGMRVRSSSKKSEEFLRSVYDDVFCRPNNIGRVLQALAGRNVRRALDMFMSIISSGHITGDITSAFAGGTSTKNIQEYRIIRVLMRSDYKFFNNSSGFISNIFYTDPSWTRPNNLLVVEVLFFLVGVRKDVGDNGQIGFSAVSSLKYHLETFGFPREDTSSAIEFLVGRGLVESDRFKIQNLSERDCVRATASAWAHMRILSSRIEYLVGVLPVTAISDDALRSIIFDRMQIENRFGDLTVNQMVQIVRKFREYMGRQFSEMSKNPAYGAEEKTGGAYILRKIDEALEHVRHETSRQSAQLDWLDE